MKIKFIKSVFALIAVLNTSACALYSKEFDSKYEKGVGCKSISEVNQMVDAGVIKGADDQTLATPLYSTSEKISKPIMLSDQGMIQRVQEEPLRVWIAPYQDEQGNFHEASVVHTVIKPGYWQLYEKS